MDRRAHVDAQSASSQPVQPVQPHGGPRAPGYAPLCAGPSAPSGLPTPAVLPSLSKRVHVAGPEGVQQPPPLPVASHLVFPNAAGLNPHFAVQLGGLGAITPAPAPPPAAAPGRSLICTFACLHSKAVGVKAKVHVQEKPFSRVTWVEMKTPSPPICERCTSTLQKHFKKPTSSKQLCSEFLKYVLKYRCRLCQEWVSTDTVRRPSDFLCAIHATEGDVNQLVTTAASTRQTATQRPDASSSANGGSGPPVPDGRGDDASIDDGSAVHPARSSTGINGRSLPYDLKLLHWNADYTRNTEEKYCYCGQHKQQPSLQCNLCKNWFHLGCISDLSPAKDSSRFLPFQLNYDFTCAVCSSSNCERYELITCSWIDSVLGAIGNLMWETQREFFKVTEVADHLDTHWDVLCFRRQKHCNWRGPLNSYFTNNKQRLRQRKPYWGIADPNQDGLGPILQPCRVLRGRARLAPENTAKLPRGPAHPPPDKAARASKVAATRDDQLQNDRAASTGTEQQQSERASEAKPGGLGGLDAVAAQLLLEAVHLTTRRCAADGNTCVPQHALHFIQELLAVPAVAPAGGLLPTAAGQQLASAPVGAFLSAGSELQLPTSLGVPTVKQQLPTAPAMTLLAPAVKRNLPANAQGLQVGGAEPPTKRSREGTKALHDATLQAAVAKAKNLAYEQLAFL